MTNFETSLTLQYLLDLTTNALSVEDYTNMGIKVLVFHIDNLDCQHCQQLHQKLEQLKEDFQKNCYHVILYYSREDQDVFRTYRKEFNNKIDVASFLGKEFDSMKCSDCNSSIYEVFGTYLNNYSHEEITTGFNNFLQRLDINFEDEMDTFSTCSIDSNNSRNSLESSEKPVKKKSSHSEFIKQTILNNCKRFSKNFLRYETKSPCISDSSEFYEIDTDREEDDDEPIVENDHPKYLENQHIKDTLEMGFKVLIFQMDDLKCDHCLQIHQSINDQLNDLSEAMITSMLTYSKIDQNMFNLLNKFTRNKVEIHETENMLESNSSYDCHGSVTIMYDFDNIIQLDHDEMSIETISRSCGI